MSSDRNPRILSRDELGPVMDRLRSEGKRIVFTNGCFDVIHSGHVRLLEGAAALGDVLVVGLNSDSSVRRLKGELRPILPELERAELLAALRSVDYVTVFPEETPSAVIDVILPDVLVKGGDYDPAAADGALAIVGAETVRAHGGTVCVVPLVEGRSTTDVIRTVVERYAPEKRA